MIVKFRKAEEKKKVKVKKTALNWLSSEQVTIDRLFSFIIIIMSIIRRRDEKNYVNNVNGFVFNRLNVQ
jgi:hypothetical protein